jgi:hypothetical protein
MGSDAEFRDGVAPLETLGIPVCHKTIQRVSEAVGAQVAAQQHSALGAVQASEQAKENAPDLLVVEGDGMRIRELVEKGAIRNGELDNGWRECNVGVVIRCQRGYFKPDGKYEHPQALLQTYLATMDDIHVFGPLPRAEAERRGLHRAHEVICLTHASELAVRPPNVSDLPVGSAERIVWTHIQYIETYRAHMDYPRYRLKGWPIASGHVEATCKRIGNRMKGANKRWTLEGAESIAALIRDRASDDNRWASRWPPQILAA